ncbi:MAG: enoyl-CoA hydratase-related protein [Solirubrobacterales bacterium]
MSEQPTAPTASREGELVVLDLGDGENRLNADWVEAVEAALQEAEGLEAPRALVTVASGKFWSNGLDLDWMAANGEQVEAFMERVHGVFAAFLGSGVPTVAAVQGHVFAAGAMFAVAHDQIVMREDRGFFCLPEVDIRLPFTPGMNALLRSRLSPAVAHDAMTTARRYGGAEAAAAGIAAAAVPEDRVREEAFERARARAGSDPATLAAIKQRLYAEALATLRGS